jgi:hypothetical protein
VSESVEETLGWEAEQRPRAGLASILAGLLLLATTLITIFGPRDFPTADFPGALRDAAAGNAVSQKAQQVLYVDDNAATFLASGLLGSLAFVGVALTLGYLGRAVGARRPETPSFLARMGVIAPITAAVGSAMASIARVVSANDFAAGDDRSADAGRDALTAPAVAAGDVLYSVGVLAVALVVTFTALNAMRVGLLTRFLGVLGILSGVVWILPQVDQIGLVRSSWFVLVGLLILGRLPSGTPAAWETGRAEPWPSRLQVAEARAAKAEPEPEPEPAPRGAAAPRQPQRQKRKRRK